MLAVSEEGAANNWDTHLTIAKAREEATSNRLKEIKADILEYESLKSGTFDMSELMTVARLPEMLIKARIARGMT